MVSKPIAALVAAFLLAISCMASACETKCSLGALGTGCHHAGSVGATAGHAMAGMQDCGEAATAAAGASVKAASSHPCAHLVCEQQPQAFAKDEGVPASERMAMQQAPILVAIVFPLQAQSSRFRRPEAPPLRAPLLVSLQAILRI